MSIQNSQQISDIKTMLVKGMNGEGIESIEKTATEGFIDTYTITYTDGTKTTFDVTNGNWGIWTSAVTAAQGATSVTINNDAIGTTSILEVYSENASGTVVTVNDIDVSAGTAVLTFPALAEATAFILHIINGTASGGGGVATDDYLDLNNKPQINGVTLTGNKTTADFGLVSTFLGDLTEWNALSTDEKKSYDHASITGAGGGEYNVNRTTGNLVLTAGVPATYPASQVMLSDGVTSVESALGSYKVIASFTGDGSKTYGDAIAELVPYANQADLLIDNIHLFYPRNTGVYFSLQVSSSGSMVMYGIRLDSTSPQWKSMYVSGGAATDYLNQAVAQGNIISLCKRT